MPRYYFHIRHGDHVIRDETGAELPDRARARKEAVLWAREILTQEMRGAEPWDHVLIEMSEGGRHLETIQMAAVFFDGSGRQE